VQGSIEQDEYAMVMLTKNSPYFSNIDSAQMINLIVQNAFVTVCDGVNTDTLHPLYDPNYFPPYIYKGSHLKGVIGNSYSLRVEAEGKVLTAHTTIPAPQPLDSVWFQTEPNQDSLGYLWAIISDPPGVSNFYRLFTKRLHRDNRFFPILGSVYDDRFFDGQTLTFSISRGITNLSEDNSGDAETTYFKVGDTIVLKACAIDKAHYDFWYSAERAMFSGGNPFATPSTIPSNIEGGGLGVWGGYGAINYTVVAKK